MNNDMKQLTVIFFTLMLSLSVQAQKKGFSPEKFEASLEEFVTREAQLSREESDKFFPLFREMHEKQRAIMRSMRKQDTPASEEASKQAIEEFDRQNIEIKKLEQSYHQKMLRVVPAKKVFEAIKAENRFHRRMMKGWQNHAPKPKGQQKDKQH